MTLDVSVVNIITIFLIASLAAWVYTKFVNPMMATPAT